MATASQNIVKFTVFEDNLAINGLRTIKIANNDNIPGVKFSYKWGEVRFTAICNNNRIAAFIKLFLKFDCDFISPQPKIVTKSGAAKPPRPAIR